MSADRPRAIDLKRDLPALYRPGSREFTEVVVPPTTYLTVDGHGDPNTSPAYLAAVQALYTTGYAVRAAFRHATGGAFVVGPLEGLWSSADPTTFVTRDKSAWEWTMMIPLPDVVAAETITEGIAAAAARGLDVPVDRVRVQRLDEGRCLQIMHLGSFDDEAPTLARLHDEIMPARGL
ncbi:GyrI-like domain-containing protein, partial [Microbacterium sp.]|uniref:GyrI-like domain-containing protein n=1 Tax=Microbacterium sp. TaxID=51671 RepID=UPI003A871FE4